MMAATALGLLALGGCDDGEGGTEDTSPPTSSGRIFTSGGIGQPLGERAVLLNTREATVQITASEPGRIYYTTDGSEPTPGDAFTAIGTQRVGFSVRSSLKVRWVAEDRAGNREATVHSGEVVFDRDPPVVTLDPDPTETGVDTFAEPVVVRVTANEPGSVYWAFDGLPLPGEPGTTGAVLPADIRVSRSAALRLRVVDRAGNRVDRGPYHFVIDTQAPTTTADPPGGSYLAAVQVRLLADDAEGTIHYTTDGSAPTTESRAYDGPLTMDADTDLKYRAVDPGGNLEPIRLQRYRIGPLGPRAGAPGLDAHRFDTAGGMALAAALQRASGLLSGQDEAAGFGRDWAAWAVGRTVADALDLQSGAGIHGMYSPRTEAQATSGQGTPDGNGNGTSLDDTFNARTEALAQAAGATVPRGLFPLHAFYVGASARLLRPVSGERTPDGRPTWVADYALVRWEGANGRERALTPDALAGALSALVARGRSGTVTGHRAGADLYGTTVAPVLGLRCGGCHRSGGAAPTLAAAADYLPLLDLEDPAQSPLVDLLDGSEPHFNDPAPTEQVVLVREWIAAGGTAEASTVRPGVNAEEGFLSLLALEQAAHALELVRDSLGLEPATEVLGGLTDGEDAGYFPARIAVVEGQAGAGLPRPLDGLRLEDPTFSTGEQARLLSALVQTHALAADRRALIRDTPLAGTEDAPDAPTLAGDLARSIARNLTTRAFDEPLGAVAATWHPRNGQAPRVDAVAAGDAAVALFRFQEDGPAAGLPVSGAAGRIAEFLRTGHATPGGDFRREYDTFNGTAIAGERPGLDVQLAVLSALSAYARSGDSAARAAAIALWGRLDALWWDADVGAWQTALGDPDYAYTPALAARVFDALVPLVDDPDFPGVEVRLQAFFDRVVLRGLRFSETWLSGEFGLGPDSDGDGTPRPEGVPLGNGVAPVFVRDLLY